MDVGSEGWRWMGPTLRYLLSPAYRILKGRKYNGRLWYLAPSDGGEGEKEVKEGEEVVVENEAGEKEEGERKKVRELKSCSHPCDVCRGPLEHGKF